MVLKTKLRENTGIPQHLVKMVTVAEIANKISKKEELTHEDICTLRNNPQKAYPLMQRAIFQGYSFSFEQILAAGNPTSKHKHSIAHSMAGAGYGFTIAQIEKLGNAKDDTGWSLSHAMADAGQVFSFDEIIRLGNPKDYYGVTLAHVLAGRGKAFTITQLIKLGDPKTLKRGERVSDIMKKKGVLFSDEDEKRLTDFHNTKKDK